MIIPVSLYKDIQKVLPILCVDIVITEPRGRYLLLRRTNEPLQGEWYIVGGRMLQGESAESTARRKLKEEIGVSVDKLDFIGFYEDQFDRNSMESDILYHTVSLVFRCEIAENEFIQLDKQSSEWKWANTLPVRFRIKNCKVNV